MLTFFFVFLVASTLISTTFNLAGSGTTSTGAGASGSTSFNFSILDNL
jgi:hypothetical protein